VAGEHAYLRRLVFVAGAALQIVALVVLWRSGTAAHWRDALARRLRSPIALRFSYGAAVAAAAWLAALPAAIVSYRLAVAYALTQQPVAEWLRDVVLIGVIFAAAAGLLTAFVYALVARTRLWYLFAAAGAFAFALLASIAQPVVIAPLFDSFSVLASSNRLADDVRRLERRAGADGLPVYVDARSRRTFVAAARTSGVGAAGRLILTDTLVEEATPPEVGFFTARELGHYLHGDVMRLAVARAIMFVVCIALGVAVADRIGFRRDDDALSRLPLVAAFAGVAALLALPILNAYARRLEAGADRYALALTGDRAGAVRALIRLSDESLSPLCPSRFERAYFLSHDALGTRIAVVTGRSDPCR
jgi:STE24 endopeptidase